MKEYVLGFMFSPCLSKVVLIKKEKPAWQKGCLNGVGGKIEPNDTDHFAAMVREFSEETGVATYSEMWNYFAVMQSDNDIDYGGKGGARVHCFYCFSDLYKEVKTRTDEEIWVVNLDAMTLPKFLETLEVLIPLAKSSMFKFTTIKY